MSGVTNLDELLRSMSPKLIEGVFVFCSVGGTLEEHASIKPIATFMEAEGLTLVISKEKAKEAGFAYEGEFSQITLTVHSSLDAVGLTAAVSSKLASKGISANVIAAYYHDHIFVQTDKAHAAMTALKEFC
jgi:hypothetical protein